jgi:superfamily II DNA/RNA helicase
MGASNRGTVLAQFRSSGGRLSKKCLIVYDPLCRSAILSFSASCDFPRSDNRRWHRTINSELHQIPIVINFDMPRSPEDYVHRVSCASSSSSSSSSFSSGHSRTGFVINIVACQSDIDMLRAIESFYRITVAELPFSAESFS